MMQNIFETTPSLFPKNKDRRKPSINEYRGQDGLIYCSKCNTPKECKIIFLGNEMIMPCICECRQQELEEEKIFREKQKELSKINKLKAVGIQEKHLLECNFSVAEENRDIMAAKHYVDNWTRVKDDNLGLLFWGNVGTGKSFIAACIANALIEKNVPVLMTNFSKILNQMGVMYSDERYQYIASFSNFQLLIIDDLGIERKTEYALEQLYAVIDERYKSGLPLIITTNLTINEIRNPSDIAHSRIYSRILEMCTPVHIAGEDCRRNISKNKQDIVKEILFL